jgi:lipid-A-disaccharide synthase
MESIARRMPDVHFCVAAVSNLERELYGDLATFKNVTLVFEDTYNLLLHARAAVVTSGTATLETALFRVPQVVVYKANALSYWLARFMITVRFISLVNLVAGREVVRELIQSDATADRAVAELKRLVADGSYRNQMLSGYDDIINVLDTGSASENTAALMVKFLTEATHETLETIPQQ